MFSLWVTVIFGEFCVYGYTLFKLIFISSDLFIQIMLQKTRYSFFNIQAKSVIRSKLEIFKCNILTTNRSKQVH